MASAVKQEPDNGGEYLRPDAKKAIEIYDRQIKPKLTKIATLKGDLSEPWGDVKEYGRIAKKDFNFVQSLVDEEDDAKRDHRLICLAELLKARGLFMPRDLVSIAGGEEGADIVPIGKRARAPLATLQMGVPSDGTETDLAGEDEGDVDHAGEDSTETVQADDFTEATAEELAQQEGREKSQFERMREATYGEESVAEEEAPTAA